ncbi:MAG TPA: hypothetical protein VHS59_14450 [Bacillota bacterium]|nr:hypothetical protein [Bacillota bacterium]
MGDDKIPLKKDQLLKIGRYLVFAGVGVALLIMSGTFSSETQQAGGPESKVVPGPGAVSEQPAVSTLSDQITRDETALETRLTEILSRVEGAGQVQVRVNLASTTQQQYAVNTSSNRRTTQEKDSSGAVRTVSETIDDGQLVLEHGDKSGSDVPVVVKASKPEILGVLVVAEGASNEQVKLTLTRTTETLLNLSAHRISVQPMEK